MEIRLDVGSAHGIANFVARFSYVGRWNPQCNVFSKNCIDRMSVELKKISEDKKRPHAFKKALDNAWKIPSIVNVNILPKENNLIRYEFTIRDAHPDAEMRITKLQDQVIRIFKQKIVEAGKQFKIRSEFSMKDLRTWWCGGDAIL